MGGNHGRVIKNRVFLVFKYLNKLSFKLLANDKYSILAFTFAFIILKLYYNVAALFYAIIICVSYLYYDFVNASEDKENCLMLPLRTEQENTNTKKNCVKEDLNSNTLLEENEDLKVQLKRMERDKYEELKRVNEDLVKTMKSDSLKLKWWVYDRVYGDGNEVSRLEKRCEKLAAERDEMLKRVACLEERCERLAFEKAEVAEGNSVHEKFDVLMDVLNEHLVVNSGRRSESDDGYQFV